MHMLEQSADQATGLRAMRQEQPVQVIAVTSGKGGVGKTSVSINLATAMALRGKRVMLLDADLGLANVDVLLGLRAHRNLKHLVDGECELQDILLTGPGGMRVVPASSGQKMMAQLNSVQHAAIVRAFATLHDAPEVLIVDTAAGIADSVVQFTQAAQQVVVVVCDEPASLTDAYALIKVLSTQYGQRNFRVLANMVRDDREGRALFQKLATVTDRFLDVALDYTGAIPFDHSLRRAVQCQSAVTEVFPESRIASAFRQLAMTAQDWPLATGTRGNIEFFFERLIAAGQQREFA